MDWLEGSEIRKDQNRSQNRQRRDTCFHLSSHHRRSFPTSNSYQIERAKTTTEAVTDSHQTVFASDTASSMSNKKDKEKKRLITHAEWIKMTVGQQDAVKAKNKKTRPKCEFCEAWEYGVRVQNAQECHRRSEKGKCKEVSCLHDFLSS